MLSLSIVRHGGDSKELLLTNDLQWVSTVRLECCGTSGSGLWWRRQGDWMRIASPRRG